MSTSLLPAARRTAEVGAISLLFCLGVVTAKGGTVAGVFTPIAPGTSVDLTQEGATDWVHWGLYNESSLNRKSGVPAMISDFTLVKPAPTTYVLAFNYSDNFNGYTWVDGWPQSAETNTTTGVWAYQSWPVNPAATGLGFRITAPADTSPRVLKVYVGTFEARGQLRASLSDGGLPYTDTSLYNDSNGPGGVYTLTYSANSPGQKLTVEWILYQRATNSSEANVTLQAAALTAPNANNPPLVFLERPLDLESFAAPGTVPLSATAADLDGVVTNVAFYEDATIVAQSATNPYSATWQNVPPGIYSLRAVAGDSAGGTRSSVPAKVYVHGTGGTLTATVSAPAPVVDLTAEGSADWVHLGSITNTTVERKAAVVPSILVATLGNAPLQRFEDGSVFYSWSDGTPTPANAATSTGVFVHGLTNGFLLTAPADTTARKLRVYVGGYGVRGTFEAYLSDLSAPPYADRSVNTVYDPVNVVYEIDYTAASAGQQLRIRFEATELFDRLWGNVNFQAATLQDGLVGPVRPYIKSAIMGTSGLVLKFDTEPNRSYTVEYSDAPGAVLWNTLHVVAGTGGEVTVEDPVIGTTSRFYRVFAQ